MKINYKSLVAASMLLCSNLMVFAQSNKTVQSNQGPVYTGLPNRGCGTGILPQQFETWVQSLQQQGGGKGETNNSTQSVFTIPVIVHIIHNNEPVNSVSANTGANINAAQVIDQINILNKDFNGTNADTNTIPSAFKPLLGKFKINFCLAAVNPTGGVLPEPGIDRINRVSKGWTAPPYSNTTYIDNTIKPNSIWDPNRYFNIWVLNLGSSLLGYATFPNPGSTGLGGLTSNFGTATTDGVVILNKSFGSVGTGSTNAPYHKGRTATHEVGHWVGLRHVWGDSNCGNDFCNDTPTQQTANYGCVAFPHVTCSNGPNGDMFMNFMDYGDDPCLKMFSKDQMYRAQLIMANAAFRAPLLTSTVCNVPTVTNDIGVVNIISPTYSQVVNCNPFINPVVKIHNFGSNMVTSATFTYNIDGAGTQTFNYTGNLSPNTSATITLPQINGISNGTHYFAINANSVNAGSDSNTGNNYSFQPFSITNGYTIAASGATTICSGNNATLTVSGGATSYTWNPSAISGTSAVVSPGATTIYSVSGTFSNCVKISTVQITVNITPTLTANSTTICTGGTATLIASGATTYSWSTTQTTSSITVTPASQTVYTVTGTNGVCSSAKTLTVSIGPNLGIIPVATSTSFCNGGSATITASGASTYTWQPGNLNGSSISVNPSSTTVYTVSGTAAACTGSNSISITVNANPTVAASAANPTVCIPGSGTTLNGLGASTYTWQPGNLTGPSVPVNPTSSTTYTVVGATAAGCLDTKTVFVTANSKPIVNVATSTPTLCVGEIGTLFATGATSYVWNPGSLSGANVTVTPSSATVYTVTGTSNGCTDVKTVAISVFPCTGLNSYAAAGFQLSLFPNPFKDELKIDASEEVTVTIYNAIGEEMGHEIISRTGSINTSSLPNAVYFVHVKGANQTRVLKVIKN
ncbi:MAG: T9SS type A sorting domain-containing protein [Sphingobacteriaceae bacterium]|jgi:hypothetical protein